MYHTALSFCLYLFKTYIMKKLIYIFLTVLIVACSGEDGSNNQSSCNGDNPVYLDDNGITIKACDDAEVYSTGIINGETYTVVNEIVLRDMLENEEDVSRVVTTKVTDMSSMFPSASSENEVDEFNQDISHWDVSNVTNMERMFFTVSAFNQPIGNWDVSNVTNMSGMFFDAAAFNQNINSWDVSSVTDMRNMFISFMFNQPLNNWDVSNVTTMREMFLGAGAFNQDISNWDVSNVTDMGFMFTGTPSFNKPLASWDVSNVTNMEKMFREAIAYNQDLSSWSVNGVTNCGDFSLGATSWTLPQPNFTNCTP